MPVAFGEPIRRNLLIWKELLLDESWAIVFASSLFDSLLNQFGSLSVSEPG
jgi:hypothetical protein